MIERQLKGVLRSAPLLALLLAGCAGIGGGGSPGNDRAYPVWESRDNGIAVAEGSDASAPERVASLPSGAESKPTRSAVIELMQRARREADAGRPDGAAEALERALRIEPRNPVLWHNLAVVRMRQKRWSQAENLARRSLSYAAGDRRLQRRNWELVAAARRAQGDPAGARVAERRAAALD